MHPATTTWNRIAIATAAAIVLVGDVLVLLSGLYPSRLLARVADYFWADQESNLWTWYSSFLLGALAIAFVLLASRAGERAPSRRRYAVFAAVALLMSADETAQLHEGLGYLNPDRAHEPTSHWLLLGVPLALVAGLLILWLARGMDPVLRRRLVVAGVVYLAGAVGLETVGGYLSVGVGLPRFHPLYVLEVTVEEGLEFAGTLLAIRAAVGALLLPRPAAPVTPAARQVFLHR